MCTWILITVCAVIVTYFIAERITILHDQVIYGEIIQESRECSALWEHRALYLIQRDIARTVETEYPSKEERTELAVGLIRCADLLPVGSFEYHPTTGVTVAAKSAIDEKT